MAKSRIYYTRDKIRDGLCREYTFWSTKPMLGNDGYWRGGRPITTFSRPFEEYPKLIPGQMITFEQKAEGGK